MSPKKEARSAAALAPVRLLEARWIRGDPNPRRRRRMHAGRHTGQQNYLQITDCTLPRHRARRIRDDTIQYYKLMIGWIKHATSLGLP
jgi:hypothetical protein